MKFMKVSVLLALATLWSAPLHANLVQNGDFSAGVTGFSSSYAVNTNVYGEGEYTVDVDPHAAHVGGASFGDHTTGSGLMLIANGASNIARYVWAQSLGVAAGGDYVFSGWAASWGTFGNGAPDPSPPILRLVINGSQIGSDFLVEAINGRWSEFQVAWNSGATTSATIQIFDVNAEPVGNDFALDDLRFVATQAVAEPGSLALLAIALGLLAFTRILRHHA